MILEVSAFNRSNAGGSFFVTKVGSGGEKKRKYREIQRVRGSSEMINEPSQVDVRFVRRGTRYRY